MHWVTAVSHCEFHMLKCDPGTERSKVNIASPNTIKNSPDAKKIVNAPEDLLLSLIKKLVVWVI